MKCMHSNEKVLVNIYKDKIQTCFKMYKTTLCLPLWNMIIIYTDDTGYAPFAGVINRSFPHAWLIPGFVTRLTRRVSLVEQELHTLPSGAPAFSPGIYWGPVGLIFGFLCSVLQIIVCSFVFLFLLVIVLRVLLRFTASHYPFGIYKHFVCLPPSLIYIE